MNPFPETIAVVVTAYNYAHFLEPCLASVLAQTRTPDEIVVIDDGSTDRTPEIMAGYDGLRYVRTENGGQAAAFNRGTTETQADLVLFLDADDTLAPHAIETVMHHARGDMAHLMFELELIDGAGASQGLHPGLSRGLVADNRPAILHRGSFALAPTSGNVFSRAFLDAAMPMPEPRWRISADCYLIRAAGLFGRSIWLRDVLGSYRMHFNNGYARLVPGGWDPGLQLSNRADVAAALTELAEAPEALLGPEAALLRRALRFRAEALQSETRDHPPLPYEIYRALLTPRYLPLAPLDRVVTLETEPELAAGRRSGPGVTEVDLRLPVTAGPLMIEFELVPNADRETRVELDGELAAIVAPGEAFCGLSYPSQPLAPPDAVRIRFTTEADEDVPVVLAFQVSAGRTARHAPLLPGPTRVPASILAPGLQAGGWALEGDRIALLWSTAELSFSVPEAGRYVLILGLTATPAPGWLTILQEGDVIFQASTGQAAEIAVPVQVQGSCTATLAVHFRAESDAMLRIDALALRPPEAAPQLSVGEYLTLFEDRRGVLGAGWIHAEQTAPQMAGNEAVLTVSVPPRAVGVALELDLEMGIALPDGQVALVGVSHRGEMLARAEILGDGKLSVPVEAVPGHGRLELVLHSVIAGAAEESALAPIGLRGISLTGRLEAEARPRALPPRQEPPHARWLAQGRAAMAFDPGPARNAALVEARAGLVTLIAGSAPALSLILVGGSLDALVDLAEACRALPLGQAEAEAMAALVARDDAGSQLAHALAAILTVPAHLHPCGGDLQAWPIVFCASPRALGRYLGAAPELVTQAAHEAYRSYLDRLFETAETALVPGPGMDQRYDLAAAAIRSLRATRTIFGDGNLRDLFSRHARLQERLLVDEGAQLAMPRVTRPGLRRLRVGVLVRDVNASPEGWALTGMYGGLDPERFERVLIRMSDAGAACPPFFDRELHVQARDTATKVAQIRAEELDVFVAGAYARDVETVNAIYAHRLAPLQFWHGAVCPTTSGLAAFDGVFTSAVMEPEFVAQDHYAEPIHWVDAPTQHAFGFPPPAGARAACRAELNLAEDAVLFVSTALSHKLLDPLLEAWAAILRAAPEAVLALAPFAPNWSMAHNPARFQDRLQRAGLPLDRVHVFPPLTSARVGDLLAAGDLFLDSFPYSGSTTICEALAQGTPALSVAGTALRQLTATSWLRAYELDALVASSPEAYVAAAVRFAEDPEQRRALRETVAGKSRADPPLYDDRATYGTAYGQALWHAAEASGLFPGLGTDSAPAKSVAPEPAAPAVLRAMQPPVLAILASPRTGSTLLCAVLNRTPGVLCHFELFHRCAIQYARHTDNDPGTMAARDADQAGFLARVRDAAGAEGRALMAFKHFHYMEPETSDIIISNRDIRLVQLSRANLLAQFSSARIAEITGKWAAHRDRVGQTKIDFDPEEFTNFMNYQRWLDTERMNLLARAGRHVLCLEYTELQTPETRRLLSEHIGIHIPDSAQPDIRKQNSPNILERYINPDVVALYLAERDLEHWAREELR